MTTYDSLGRGRKKCPACKSIVGAGRKKCPVTACGHEFGGKKKAQASGAAPARQAVPVLADPLVSRVDQVMLIPDGPCPAPLAGTSEESLKVWIPEVLDGWRRHKAYDGRTALSVEALEWWARQTYPYGTDEFKQLRKNLNLIIGGAT